MHVEYSLCRLLFVFASRQQAVSYHASRVRVEPSPSEYLFGNDSKVFCPNSPRQIYNPTTRRFNHRRRTSAVYICGAKRDIWSKLS